MTNRYAKCLVVVALLLPLACAPLAKPPQAAAAPSGFRAADGIDAAALLRKYTTVRLTADLSHLTDAQRDVLRLLIEASAHMDDAFWRQAYGQRGQLLGAIADAKLRRFASYNYGPWDRLAGNVPFVDRVGAKPKGARFYPADVTVAQLEAADASVRDLYTMVERGKDGTLRAIPYAKYFAAQLQPAARLLEKAAALAVEPGLKKYLKLRAAALVSDDYRPSDLAWMDMKDNVIDVVIGPIETYEDQVLGAKASFEAYVLLKDVAWSARLQRYAALLPELQKGLPVDRAYKRETPGSDSDLNAYDVLYYAGDCNAGSKTIAINLPNDEQVQLQKGTRRLQLKNAMRAKFDAILTPIAGELIVAKQRAHVSFDAFFANTMFHEVAHGLGIKNTIDGGGTVRVAMKDQASALEEGKADVLGLYMITSLFDRGELTGAGVLEDYFVTFAASIFRSIRFGAASAHGRANLVRFNFFRERGALLRDDSGHYRIDASKVREAGQALSRAIIVLQGNGDYDAAVQFMRRYGVMDATLKSDLARLDTARIPVDVVFEQGTAVLGL